MAKKVQSVEVTPKQDNQLMVIVKESGLEQSKAQFILDKFQDSFEFAAEWERKAAAIVVTSPSQVMEMKAARAGRLILRERRLEVEKSRKELKEQSLREGKAIDGIANVLKALIVPIEEHLEKQEKYVEIKAAEAEAAHRAEVERRMEEERIAKEKAEAEARAKEQERIRKENEKLKAEAVKREKALAAERAKAEAERKAIEEKARKEREALEEANKIEREKQAKAMAAAKAKADAERKKQEEAMRKEREEAQKKQREADELARKAAEEKRVLEARLAAQIACPKCGHKFTPKKGA